jgi:hypothetical protein
MGACRTFGGIRIMGLQGLKDRFMFGQRFLRAPWNQNGAKL